MADSIITRHVSLLGFLAEQEDCQPLHRVPGYLALLLSFYKGKMRKIMLLIWPNGPVQPSDDCVIRGGVFLVLSL